MGRRPWREPSLIPNRVGYKVVLLLKSNEVVADEVVWKDGLCQLKNHHISMVAGWASASGDKS